MPNDFINILSKKPVFCFTSDTDWAPESCVEAALKLFEDNDVPLTPFITHQSRVIERRYARQQHHVGLHPNFQLGSTHGSSPHEVIANVIRLWPGARCYRSHSYVDSFPIASEFYARGILYSSNLYLHLQPNIFPLRDQGGLTGFPVFLNDDVCAIRRTGWTLTSHMIKALNSPGLKIFNFHPVHIALNTPSTEYYAEHRDDFYGKGIATQYPGKGALTLLLEILDFAKTNPGAGIFYLDDLYLRCCGTVKPKAATNA